MDFLEKRAIIIELHYLPCIEYFLCLLDFDKVVVDVYENFEKQSYRNRCKVLTSQGEHTLSVPVLKSQSKQLLKDVQIDYDQKWLKNHWRTICSIYGKAPFFEYYIDYFEQVFFKKKRYLIDLNIDLLTICLKILDISSTFQFSEEYVELPVKSQFLDLRSKIHPKKKSILSRRFDTIKYQQVFGRCFVNNLSIIDLIFCEGPNALNLMKSSIKRQNATSTSKD